MPRPDYYRKLQRARNPKSAATLLRAWACQMAASDASAADVTVSSLRRWESRAQILERASTTQEVRAFLREWTAYQSKLKDSLQ